MNTDDFQASTSPHERRLLYFFLSTNSIPQRLHRAGGEGGRLYTHAPHLAHAPIRHAPHLPGSRSRRAWTRTTRPLPVYATRSSCDLAGYSTHTRTHTLGHTRTHPSPVTARTRRAQRTRPSPRRLIAQHSPLSRTQRSVGPRLSPMSARSTYSAAGAFRGLVQPHLNWPCCPQL